MKPDNRPVPETWYRDLETDRILCVTDVDTTDQVIEVQHFDGNVEQIDFSEWVELDLELAEPPEDWSGPLDSVDAEDLDGGEAAARRPASPPDDDFPGGPAGR